MNPVFKMESCIVNALEQVRRDKRRQPVNPTYSQVVMFSPKWIPPYPYNLSSSNASLSIHIHVKVLLILRFGAVSGACTAGPRHFADTLKI